MPFLPKAAGEADIVHLEVGPGEEAGGGGAHFGRDEPRHPVRVGRVRQQAEQAVAPPVEAICDAELGAGPQIEAL